MQRWNRKKTQFPVLVFLLFLFIVFSNLHSENSILQIQDGHDRSPRHQDSITYVKPNLFSRQNHGPGMAVFGLAK